MVDNFADINVVDGETCTGNNGNNSEESSFMKYNTKTT